MKNILFLAMFLLVIVACNNSGKKDSIERTDEELQLLQKITNPEFKEFIGTFAFRQFPWDVSEIPMFREGELHSNFYEMSLTHLNKFINPDVTDIKGFYTGYAFFENEYIAIIYFYNFTSLATNDNSHTMTYLLTFSYDGRLINQQTIGESAITVFPNAQKESRIIEGIIYLDKPTTLSINNYLLDKPDGMTETLTFSIDPNGAIKQTDEAQQQHEKITNSEFRTFVESFTIAKFPWDVNQTPLFVGGEVPEDFHLLPVEDIMKFIDPEITDNMGFFTGYAFYENEYIAIIYFQSLSSLFGGDNYSTLVNLLTYSYDGKLIGKILIGEAKTIVNSNAQRESQKLTGSISSAQNSSIVVNYFLEDQPNGSDKPLNFILKPNGEIEVQ